MFTCLPNQAGVASRPSVRSRRQRTFIAAQAAVNNPTVLPIARMTGKLQSELPEWQALKEHVKVLSGTPDCSGRAVERALPARLGSTSLIRGDASGLRSCAVLS